MFVFYKRQVHIKKGGKVCFKNEKLISNKNIIWKATFIGFLEGQVYTEKEQTVSFILSFLL
jgi:hypothetical protein